MRLFRNLSVGRKLAASAILAILLLGGLVLLVQRELARRRRCSRRPSARRWRRRPRHGRARCAWLRGGHGAAGHPAVPDHRGSRSNGRRDAAGARPGTPTGSGRRPQGAGLTPEVDRASLDRRQAGPWPTTPPRSASRPAPTRELDRPRDGRCCPRIGEYDQAFEAVAGMIEIDVPEGPGRGAAAADDLPPGGERYPPGRPSATWPPATTPRPGASAGPRRSCGCMPARLAGVAAAGRARPTCGASPTSPRATPGGAWRWCGWPRRPRGARREHSSPARERLETALAEANDASRRTGRGRGIAASAAASRPGARGGALDRLGRGADPGGIGLADRAGDRRAVAAPGARPSAPSPPAMPAIAVPDRDRRRRDRRHRRRARGTARDRAARLRAAADAASSFRSAS